MVLCLCILHWNKRYPTTSSRNAEVVVASCIFSTYTSLPAFFFLTSSLRSTILFHSLSLLYYIFSVLLSLGRSMSDLSALQAFLSL
ncbi:hypothetical protein BDW68DRAFT_170124 [Aspergillus falconensis]